MERQDINTKIFLYNPFDKGTVAKLVSKYEEFKFTFTNMTEKRKIVAYIILLYDFYSPLREDIHDLYKRKREAAKLAGFKAGNKGYYPPHVEKALLGENEDVNAAIVRYTLAFSNPDYTMLVSFLDMFLKATQESLGQSPDKNRIANIRSLNQSIKELDESIFGGKEPLNLRKALYDSADEMKISLKPENIAERLEKGEEPVDVDPYS